MDIIEGQADELDGLKMIIIKYGEWLRPKILFYKITTHCIPLNKKIWFSIKLRF